jgi:uncharacterized protein YukE
MSAKDYGQTDYSKVSHQDLYNQLHASDPDSIDPMAGIYQLQQSSAHTLSNDIDGDLRKLKLVWKGDAFDAYESAITAISTFAHGLGDDLSHSYQSMSSLKQPLKQALKDMPNPKDTDDNDSTVGGAAAGAAAGTAILPGAGTVIGAIGGGIFGHSRDEQQRKQAHAKAILVISTYVNSITNAGTENAPAPTLAPPNLPHQVNPSNLNLTSTGAGPHTTGAPNALTVKNPHDPANHPIVPPTTPANIGTPTTVTTPIDTTTGTPSVTTGGPHGGGLAGGGVPGLAPSPGGLGGSGLASAGVGTGAGTAGLAGGATGASGSAGLLGAGAGGQNLGVGGARGAGKGAKAGRGAAAGGTRRRDGDDVEEYETWLTEDEMVWGGDTDAPPSVLGETSK